MIRSVIICSKNDNLNESLSRSLSEKYSLIYECNEEKIYELVFNHSNNSSCLIIDSDSIFFDIEELVKRFRKILRLKRFPVILISENIDLELSEQYIDAGVSDILFTQYIANSKLLYVRIKNLIRMAESSIALKELECDELTGLYTRQTFVKKAEEIIAQNPEKKYAIIGVDFENFKLTNSQYGEEKCDEFLSYIGIQLRDKLTTGFAGRFSGDQFVIIFEYSIEKEIKYITGFANEILKNAPIPHQIPKIGVYAPIEKDLPVVRCCDNAFLALREIKGIYNKNIIFYQKKLQDHLLTEQRILESMEQALEEEQFIVYYQPKHESITGKVAGAEALVRWIHPEYGFMSPGEFIPLFERNGFISKLDSFVLKQVCKDIIEWKKNGFPIVPISVNVSRRDYLEDGWIDRQLQIIDEYKIEHELIHMEVTESLYAEYMDVIIDQIKKIKKLGFAIEMDDFGAGYSSLGTLSSFPLDVIKLDISFVRHIETNEIVVENIIKMAHKLGYVTVAEGTETEEQFKILRGLGCDLIQGYCFSKPLPKKEFEKYITDNSVESIIGQNTVRLSNSTISQYAGNENILKAVLEIGESLPGGFFCYHTDDNHEIISFNRETLRIYECENVNEFRKFTKNSFDGMVHPNDLKTVNMLIKNHQDKGNDIIYLEYRVLCHSGKIKYIRNYGRCINTEQYGKIYYVFIQDCTEEYEKSLQEQKKNEVIQCLSLNYMAIYLVDFESTTITPYAINSTFDKNMNENFYKEKNYHQIREFYAKKYVAPSERESFLNVTNIENIQNEFKKTDSFNFTYHFFSEDDSVYLVEMSVRKLNDENQKTRAVLAFRRISENMIDSNAERNNSLMSMLDKKNDKTQFEILNSMTQIYSYVNLIDFKKKTIIRFDSHSHEVRKFSLGRECHSDMNQKVAEQIVDEQKKDFLKFTDLNTLEKRMKTKTSISAEFLSGIMGWIRVQYIRVNPDSFDLVVYTIQDIDKEKHHEEHLIRLSITDELTKVYNRNAFEDDIRGLKKKKISKDFVFMSVDLNGLKSINDEKGHAAGDELIKGAATCLTRCFGGNGRVYRIGGDEFVVLFYAEENELQKLLTDFETVVSKWKGKLVDSLSISYGFVTRREYPKKSIEDLAEIADKRMYDNKKRYYKIITVDRKDQISAMEVNGSACILIIKLNLTTDEYSVLKVLEKNDNVSNSNIFTNMINDFLNQGYVHESSLVEYKEKINLKYLNSVIKTKDDKFLFFYKRLYKKEFKSSTLEFIPTKDFSKDNKEVFMYAKIYDK